MDLKETLEKKNLPLKVGAYQFVEKKDPGDGALMLEYFTDEGGHFTITIYNNESEPVPDGLDSAILNEEFEICVNTVFEVEKEGYYSDVDLLKKEDVTFEEGKDPLFKSAIFTYKYNFKDEEENAVPLISFLFLRGDGGYFHKIRFTANLEIESRLLSSMEDFIISWLAYVHSINEQ